MRLKGVCLSALAVAALGAFGADARAETLHSALTRAYTANPVLGAQRANVRATDENVARAKAGYRPRITATADAGARYIESSRPGIPTFSQTTTPYEFGIGIEQTLFDGFRTDNSVRQAESGVLNAREALRNQEQTTLFDAATAYMNVLRDTAVLNLERNNVEVIEEQLRQVQARRDVGEITRTDVFQAQARLALSQSRASLAESNLRTSMGRYRQIIGVEPRALAPGRPVDHLVPRSIEQALRLSQEEHPAAKAALHAVDVAELQVRITEGELYPTLTLAGDLAQRFDVQAPGDEQFSASVVARLTVPIYEGGAVHARTRQAKETVGQRRLEADSTLDQVRSAVVSAWGQYEASKAQIAAAEAQVQASETALEGVRNEARVGQRTTLDVLNAQQELLNARVNLVTAQRDRVVASYALVQATGRLNYRVLGLDAPEYTPVTHFRQVKDLWRGTLTPDGR